MNIDAPSISDFCEDINLVVSPWTALSTLDSYVTEQISTLGEDYIVNENIAIHKTAIVDHSATIKSPAIIGPGCRVGTGALLRDGVILSGNVNIGPSCEVKCSIIGEDTALAHFNYVGNSIVGSHVNLEAGAVVANHYNEREDKSISVIYNGHVIPTGVTKFGALIGDGSKLGANSVASPGTILNKNSVVRRLELVEQLSPN